MPFDYTNLLVMAASMVGMIVVQEYVWLFTGCVVLFGIALMGGSGSLDKSTSEITPSQAADFAHLYNLAMQLTHRDRELRAKVAAIELMFSDLVEDSYMDSMMLDSSDIASTALVIAALTTQTPSCVMRPSPASHLSWYYPTTLWESDAAKAVPCRLADVWHEVSISHTVRRTEDSVPVLKDSVPFVDKWEGCTVIKFNPPVLVRVMKELVLAEAAR